MKRVVRSTDIRGALRDRQRGFLLNPFRFGEGAASDPHFANVVSLLHFEGTNGSTVFTDVQGVGWSAVNTAAIGTAQFKFGASSLDVSSTAVARIQTGTGSVFNSGTGDLTLECWIYTTGRNSNFREIWNYTPTAGSYYSLRISNGNRLQLGAASSATRITGATNLSLNTWYYVAAVRSAGVWRLYLNGVQDIGTTYNDATSYGDGVFRLGSTSFPSAMFIDEFRATVGVARTVSLPTEAFPDS